MPQPSFHAVFGPLNEVPVGFDVREEGSDDCPNLVVTEMGKDSTLRNVLSRIRGLDLRPDGFHGFELHVLSAKHYASFAALLARARSREERGQDGRVRLAFAI